MGTIKKGILGGFSGKVGTVVGSNWKQTSYMRSLATKVKNPQTPKQMAHRQKFKLMFDYLKPMSPFLKLGFQNYTKKQTALNAALSYNMKNAVYGTSPNWWLNTYKVLVTRGNLMPVQHVYFHRNGQYIFMNWGDNSGVGNAKASDLAIAVMYNTTKGEIRTITAGPERSYKLSGFQIPADWQDCWIDIHFAFITEDRKEISNSVYVGGMKLL